MKFTNALLVLLFSVAPVSLLRAQVTIGDGIAPQKFSVLELSTLTTKGGFRLPHLTEIEKLGLALDGLTDPDQQIKAKGLTVYDSTNNTVEYWDGIRWERLDIVGPWRISNYPDSIATDNAQDIFQMGRVSVGTNNGDPSAAFSVQAKNKGVLLPRVSLTGPNDDVTIPNPAEGLLVYNKGDNPNFSHSGFFYWNGSCWMKFADRNANPPAISALHCNNAQLTPSQYTKDEDYEGVMEIPYSGGNGASYPAGTPQGSVNGLHYTLQAGTLEQGNGRITFAVTGIPEESSPKETEFPISFLGKNCVAKVGHGGASIETKTYLGSMTRIPGGAEFSVNTFDGKYSLRFFAKETSSLNYTDIQIKYNGQKTSDNIIIIHTVNYNGGAFADSENDFTVTKTWKRHGDPEVYHGGRPEYRQIIFTSTDETKRMYRYSFFFGAPNNKFENYSKTKCWIFAEEIISE